MPMKLGLENIIQQLELKREGSHFSDILFPWRHKTTIYFFVSLVQLRDAQTVIDHTLDQNTTSVME